MLNTVNKYLKINAKHFFWIVDTYKPGIVSVSDVTSLTSSSFLAGLYCTQKAEALGFQ